MRILSLFLSLNSSPQNQHGCLLASRSSEITFTYTSFCSGWKVLLLTVLYSPLLLLILDYKAQLFYFSPEYLQLWQKATQAGARAQSQLHDANDLAKFILTACIMMSNYFKNSSLCLTQMKCTFFFYSFPPLLSLPDKLRSPLNTMAPLCRTTGLIMLRDIKGNDVSSYSESRFDWNADAQRAW